MSKQIVIPSPCSPLDTLRAAIVEQLHDKPGYCIVESFAEAATADSAVVVVLYPNDYPKPGDPDEFIIQTHRIDDVSHYAAQIMESGKSNSELMQFNRSMAMHNKLVNGFKRDSLDIMMVSTPIDDREPLWALATFVEPVKSEPVVQQQEEALDTQALEPEPELQPEIKLEETQAAVVVDEQVEEEEPQIIETSKPEQLEIESLPEVQAEQLVVEQPTPTTPIKEEPVMTPIPETANLDEAEFDPMQAAFINSVEQASAQPETTETAKPAAKADTEVYHLDIDEAVNYPKVDSTVEVPVKLLQPSLNSNTAFFSDFAGSPKTFSRVFNYIDNKLEAAIERGRPPMMSDFERLVVAASNDRVMNDPLHEQQYIDESRWSGSIATPTTKVPIMSPIRNPDYGDAKYIGPDAISLIQNRMKIGCKLGLFLPHTGIYFIINSPGDDDVLNTLSIVNNYRVEALRSSSGILLGNSNFYLNRQILNLFINNVAGCSLSNWNKEVILELIDERDMNIIAASIMATIYPDGYEYRQICGLVKENKVCEHVTSKLVDLRRMVFVDNSRMSEAQRNLASGGMRQISVNEVRTYQETNYIGFKKAYEITDGISFVYKAQPISVSTAAGEGWIKEIETVVDSIVTFNEDAEMRNNEIRQRINLSRIREYSHWVTEIQIDGETNVITDRAGINKLMASLSRNQEVLDKVGKTLAEFQRLSQIAIVAIPRVPCAICQKTNEKDLDISPHLIPQDAVSRFFTLALQRLS